MAHKSLAQCFWDEATYGDRLKKDLEYAKEHEAKLRREKRHAAVSGFFKRLIGKG